MEPFVEKIILEPYLISRRMYSVATQNKFRVLRNRVGISYNKKRWDGPAQVHNHAVPTGYMCKTLNVKCDGSCFFDPTDLIR
jgi:hypothetical protein